MLHHVRGATVAQPVRAGGVVRHLHQVPDPLPRQRHAAQRKKQPRRVLPGRVFSRGAGFASGTDARQVRAALAQIGFKRPQRSAPQRNNPLLVAFAAHMHPSGIQRQVAGRERGYFRYAQAPGIKQLQNRAVAQRGSLAPADARQPSRPAPASPPPRAPPATWAAPSTPWATQC